MPIEHKVKQGDCISSIAFTYGFFPETLWQHTDNSELKNLRKSMFLLCADDVVIVPDLTIKKEAIMSEQKHRFVRKGVPEVLKLQFLDYEGNPKVGLSYRLDLDGHLRHGTLDNDGYIIEVIPPDALKGLLRLGEGDNEEVIDLCLGHLYPISEIKGVQQRLNNLGYYCGAEDGDLSQKTMSAVNLFQKAMNLAISEQLNDETLSKLESI